MNSQDIRQIIGDQFQYKLLKEEFNEAEIQSYKNSVFNNITKLTKKWDDRLNSEWTSRIYLSAKMIYSATLLLNTLTYSENKNIRVTSPYLLYYSLLNCCRALNFTTDDFQWGDGSIINDSHKKIINKSFSTISKLNKEYANQVKVLIFLAKDYRELFSYKFPSTGLLEKYNFKKLEKQNIIKTCQVICEIAQLNSECLQLSLERNNEGKSFNLDPEILEYCVRYTGKVIDYIDEEDGYRIAHIFKKVKRPYSIYLMMTEGMTEDFFGAWIEDDEDFKEGNFDPDEHEVKIFDLP